MNFEGLKKDEVFVDRKKYTFYTKTRKGLGYCGYESSNTTIYVDDNDNILNVFPGRFCYLDGKVLTIRDDDGDHNSYYNIENGEELFTEYDKFGRCYGCFVNGIALIFDDNVDAYHIVSLNGELGTCKWLYRIGKKSLLVQKENKGNWSLYDYNMNLIKSDVTIDYDDKMTNNECFVACNKDENGKYYCICDFEGNVITDKFARITTKDDIHEFKTVTVTERETKRKRTVIYTELIKR